MAISVETILSDMTLSLSSTGAPSNNPVSFVAGRTYIVVLGTQRASSTDPVAATLTATGQTFTSLASLLWTSTGTNRRRLQAWVCVAAVTNTVSLAFAWTTQTLVFADAFVNEVTGLDPAGPVRMANIVTSAANEAITAGVPEQSSTLAAYLDKRNRGYTIATVNANSVLRPQLNGLGNDGIAVPTWTQRTSLGTSSTATRRYVTAILESDTPDLTPGVWNATTAVLGQISMELVAEPLAAATVPEVHKLIEWDPATGRYAEVYAISTTDTDAEVGDRLTFLARYGRVLLTTEIGP